MCAQWTMNQHPLQHPMYYQQHPENIQQHLEHTQQLDFHRYDPSQYQYHQQLMINDSHAPNLFNLDTQKFVYPGHNVQFPMQHYPTMWSHHEGHYAPPQFGFYQATQQEYQPSSGSSSELSTSSQSVFSNGTTSEDSSSLNQHSLPVPLGQLLQKVNDNKPSEAQPKTFNCKTCSKWFTSTGHLKRHFNTIIHKQTVKLSGQPDPAAGFITVTPGRASNYKKKLLQRPVKVETSEYWPPTQLNIPEALEPMSISIINHTQPQQHVNQTTFDSSTLQQEVQQGQQNPLIINYDNQSYQITMNQPENSYNSDDGLRSISTPIFTDTHQDQMMKFSTSQWTHSYQEHQMVSHTGAFPINQDTVNTAQEETAFAITISEQYAQFPTSVQPPLSSVDIPEQVEDLPSSLSKTSSVSTSSSTGEFHCGLCFKTFNRSCYLTQHNQTFHCGDKPFKCLQCGKRFSSEESRDNHALKHSGNKPFRCPKCPKSFNYKTDLRRHMCLHDNQRPFVCPECTKGFIRNDHMVKHMEIHTKKLKGKGKKKKKEAV